MQISQPDPIGGLGSISSNLWEVVLGGIKTVTAGELAKRYGFAFGADGLVTSNANMGIVPRSQPGNPSQSVSEFQGDQPSDAWKWVALAGAVAVVVLLVR